ncbi:MAG: methyl-accepting chemotaxis protein [bacterium]
MKLGSLPLKVKLPVVIVGAGLLMSALVGATGYFQLYHLAKLDVDSSISALLESRKMAVESYYAEIARNVEDMSSNPLTESGFRRLQLGWKSFATDPQAALIADYITNNPNPLGKRMNLDTAATPNTYNTQHLQFHPAFRNWIRLHDYYDTFLIDLDGNVIFTVDKESDFASNLLTGPDAKGPLAEAFNAARNDTSTTVHFSDLANYGPSSGAPAAFAAKAILAEDGTAIGVFAIQMSDASLEAVVDNPIGLGETGEVVLVGPDRAARNASRFEGRFGLLDILPDLPQLDVNPATDHVIMAHTRLTSGEIGSALTTEAKIQGVDYNILVEISDKETYANVVSARNLLILWTLVAIGLLSIIGILISKTITRPIARVTSATRTIADGDLAVSIDDADRSDEIGDIAKSLDALRQKLAMAASVDLERIRQSDAQKLVVDELSIGLRGLSGGNLAQSIETTFSEDYEMLRTDFNQTVDRLNETISMVVETSESIRSRSREISQSSEDLSNRTENQAATLEETAAALDELTTSIRSAASSAKEVEGIVQSARSEAEQSGIVVQGAVAAMTEIEKSSDQISQIIGVIDDIAFQTNLLALNAGVEAARAGDAGKGFAVVASEVRALAQRSSAAAREIKLLISASTQHVDRGVEQVGRAGQALEKIVGRVGHISTLVSNIASAAAEQSTGLAEINLGVTQLDQVTQQNAAMVEQSTAASQSLNQEAAGLSELVSQFRIRKVLAQGGHVQEVSFTQPSILRVEPPAPAPTVVAHHASDLHSDAPTFVATATGGATWQDF